MGGVKAGKRRKESGLEETERTDGITVASLRIPSRQFGVLRLMGPASSGGFKVSARTTLAISPPKGMCTDLLGQNRGGTPAQRNALARHLIRLASWTKEYQGQDWVNVSE